MRLPGNQQSAAHIDTVLFHLSDFALKRHRIDDHTVANQVEFPFTENPARNGVEHMLSPVEFEGVTGIRSTLEPRNDVVLRSQYVHDFSFPFVSPLETEQYVDFHRPSRQAAKISPTEVHPPNIRGVVHLNSCAINPQDGPPSKPRELDAVVR